MFAGRQRGQRVVRVMMIMLLLLLVVVVVVVVGHDQACVVLVFWKGLI